MERIVNTPLLRKVMEHIESHPEEWNQELYASQCGTAYCFAGHALVMTGHTLTLNERYRYTLDGKNSTGWDVLAVAAEELGLTDTQAQSLFVADNTVETLRMLAESYAGERL